MSDVLPIDGEFFIEPLPDQIIAAMEREDRYITSLAKTQSIAPSYFIEHTKKWPVGGSIKVAFKGGTEALRKKIADAASNITQHANLIFDFKNDDGSFREWTTNDTEYKGHIRVCFDRSGYWSLVGKDAVNKRIRNSDYSVGGFPKSRTLCLGGFDRNLPSNYKSTVIHEFMHAVGFHHAHQSPNASCDDAFRWDDDVGYEPTVTERGAYISDSQGRRPGVYTMMSGAPNYWSEAKVNSNMKPSTLRAHERTAGEFDPRSIMLYRFPNNYYKPNSTNCQPVGNGQNLSQKDKEGLNFLYPSNEESIIELAEFDKQVSSLFASLYSEEE